MASTVGDNGHATRDARADTTLPVASTTRDADQVTQGTTTIPGYVYLVGFIAALGGLLFGYDTGVISGAQGFLKTQFHLTSTTQEIAVSAVLIGAILGAAVSGKMADWLGRKKTLIIMAIIFAVGAILTAFAPSLWPFVILRIIVGFGIGASSVVAPMYTSELSPPAIRGKLVFLFQLMITVGILVAYLVDLGFSSAGLGWPPMFAVAVIPAAALGIGMFFLHDTPRWLASKGRWDEATAVMRRVVPTGADAEMGRIKTRLEEATHASTHELFHGGLRVALIVAVGLAILQQLVGINTIIYYAPIVTGYSGFGASATGSSLIGAILVGVVNVLATILALFLVDRVGRRPLLLFGSCGVFLTLAATGFIFMIGAPQHGLLLLIVLLLYIVSFAIGLGPTYWLIAAEVFPTRLRATGSSISTVGNWSANLIVSITFLTLINMLGKSVTFWIYAAFAVVQIVFIWFLVPETKGKPLEAIEQYWQQGRSWAGVDGRAAGREDDHIARAGAATPTSGSGHDERTAGQTAPAGAGRAAPVAIDARAHGLDRAVHATTQDGSAAGLDIDVHVTKPDGSAADRHIDVHVTTQDRPPAGAHADSAPPNPVQGS